MNKKQRVKEIIFKIMDENNFKDIENIDIDANSSLTNDLGLDSLNLAQLTVIIEAEFGIDIFEEKIIRTFGEIINALE